MGVFKFPELLGEALARRKTPAQSENVYTHRLVDSHFLTRGHFNTDYGKWSSFSAYGSVLLPWL